MITAVRALIFYIGYILAMVVVSCVLTPVALLLPAGPRSWLILRYNWFTLFWLKVTCGIRYDIQGIEHIPTDRNVVILSNHQSEWETIYLQLVTRPMSTVLKQELLKIPFFGWGLKALNPIPLDRSKPAAAMKQVLKEGQKRLADGYSVLIFPEGTRTEPGTRGNHKKGGAMLATKKGTAILPVAHNAGEHWTSSALDKKPGTIRVRFGNLIETEGRNVNDVHAEVTEWLETQVDQLSSLPPVRTAIETNESSSDDTAENKPAQP